MNTNNVLFITYENPLFKYNVDRIYTSNFLESLLELNCNIDVLCYDSNDTLENNYDNLNMQYIKFNPTNKLKVMLSLLPAMIVNRKSVIFTKNLKIKLDKNKYDIIFVNHLKMVFTLDTIIKNSPNLKLCYISHNAEYLLSKNNAVNSKNFINKLVYFQDAIKTNFYEKKWLNHFDFITTISEHDQDYYILNFKNPITKVIRPILNGIDSISENIKKKNNIILVGSFLWGPKKENLLSFLNSKNFKQLHTNNISLTVVGNADPLLVKKINSEFKGVFMTGRVKSVESFYSNSKIAIIPEVLGGGFKLKVAEAALQKTAIFSVKGAITKCNLKKDKHFIEALNFNDLINKIIDFQSREPELNLMIEETYNIAKRDFSIDKFKSDILKIITA